MAQVVVPSKHKALSSNSSRKGREGGRERRKEGRKEGRKDGREGLIKCKSKTKVTIKNSPTYRKEH
jgi:hypothetical protein